MTELASPGQLRATFLRWSLFLVPGILLLGFFSGRIGNSGPGNPWFDALEKPAIYPPPATFGIVWSILYVLMGLALAMIVTARGAPGRGVAVGAFAVQLAINLAWSPVFFAMHQITAALGVLAALIVAVGVTAFLFYRIRPLAAALLVPYLAWALFASVLTWQFLVLNPDADGAMGDAGVTEVEFR